jgi:outer membrane protein OmpA-like peptidoglycan-associated protein
MQKLLLLLGLLFSTSICTFAQQDEEKRLVSLGQDFFVPHWFMSLHAGAAYDVGEAKFSKLLSPGAQASLGYHFTPLFATRLSIGGWEARNRYAYPSEKYKWNFIQPAVDAMVDITTLIDGWEPERFFHLYAFAGVGLNISFNNDDAVNASARMANSYKLRELVQLTPNYFEKLWEDSRLNPVVRAGIGADFHITDNVALGAEVNANMLPDHFNSKLGKHDNRDWHFNAMVGVKFIIGKSHGRTDPTYQTVHKPVEPKEPKFVDVPVEKISFNVNIYFVINQSIIRTNQMAKLRSLIHYLNEHPKAFVRLSGYADKDTGTPEINMRLSVERSQVVSQFLQNAGIEEWRIRRFAKGDRVQPFDIPEDNRVCICYVYDPENPVPQKFEY